MVSLSVRELPVLSTVPGTCTHFSSNNVEYCASSTMARKILYYSVNGNGKLTASCAICRQHFEIGKSKHIKSTKNIIENQYNVHIALIAYYTKCNSSI